MRDINSVEMIRRITDAGLYCFLLPNGRKAANIKWKNIASNDYGTVIGQYSESNSNIAVLTGQTNKLMVIDLDVEKDDKHKPVLVKGKPVKLGLKEFLKHFGMKFTDERLHTYIERTQSGGLHLVYKIPSGKKELQQRIGILPGVDLKCRGNYFVIAPSTGEYGKYEIVKDMDFADIPEMPLEFYNFFEGKEDYDRDWMDIKGYTFDGRYTDLLTKAISDIFKPKTPLHVGNKITIAIAGAMAVHGISEEDAMSILSNAAKLNNYTQDDWRAPVKGTYAKYRSGEKFTGLPTLLALLEENRDKFDNYQKIVDTLIEVFKKGNEHRVVIDGDAEYGIIRDSNGNDTGAIIYCKYTTKRDKDGVLVETLSRTEVMRYIGKLTRIIRIDDETYGLHLELDNEKPMNLTIDDAITHITRHYSISPSMKQKMVLILRKYVRDNMGSAEPVSLSDVVLSDGIVKIMYDTGKISVKEVLERLLGYIPYASNVNGYISVLSWTLMAPLHYWMKKYTDAIIYVPGMVLSGETKGGKTSLADLFIHRGFGIAPEDIGNYLYHVKDIKTSFTLMSVLTESNLPAIFDESNMKFIKEHAEEIKGYSSSPRFGQLGTSSQNVNRYIGKRSFIITMNGDFDVSIDLAASNRIMVIQYTKENSKRQDMSKFMEFKNSLPPGFMYALMKDALDGMDIRAITRKFERYQDPVEWINAGISLVNILCKRYGVGEFPMYSSTGARGDTTVYDMAQAFVSEYARMENDQYKRSPIWGDLLVTRGDDRKDGRIYIYFTSSAYKFINKIFDYDSSPVNYLNNIPADGMIRVENGGRSFTKRMDTYVKRVYCISIPDYGNGSANDNTDLSKLRAIRYLKGHNGHMAGEDDIVPYGEAEQLIHDGIAEGVDEN